MVPPFLHSLPAGSSINSHCCRLAGDERVSYIDRNKKRNSVNGPNFIAPTMKCCVGKATIVSRVPACRVLQPSDFFNLFNLFLLSLHHVPSLCLVSLYPLLRVWHSNLFSLLFMCTGCRVSLNYSKLSAWFTAVMAEHLQPDLVWTTASRTFWSNESRSAITSLHLDMPPWTLQKLDDRDYWSWAVFSRVWLE